MKLILTADIHARMDQPICRKDDYIEYEKKIFTWLYDLSKKYKATILCSGDITHYANRKDSNELYHFLMENMPDMIGILGNHDLPSHSLELYPKSTISTLVRSGKYILLNEPQPMIKDEHVESKVKFLCEKFKCEEVCLHGFHFGSDITFPVEESKCHIALYHGMVLEKKDKYISGKIGKIMLDAYKDYSLILTGDNHKTFTIKKGNRYLVNPGSLFRDDAAQIDFTPSVFLYDTDTKELEQIFAPTDGDEFYTDYIVDKNKKKADYAAFIEVLNTKFELTVNFKDSMENCIRANNIREEVVKEIRNSFLKEN